MKHHTPIPIELTPIGGFSADFIVTCLAAFIVFGIVAIVVGALIIGHYQLTQSAPAIADPWPPLKHELPTWRDRRS